MATSLDPRKMSAVWESVEMNKRVRNAVLLLSVHGFITHAESQRAYQRIDKWEESWSRQEDPTHAS